MQYKRNLYKYLIIILSFFSLLSIVFSKEDSTITSLKNIYKTLEGIELKDKKAQVDKISYKLPYYKMNLGESMYYNSFINSKKEVYKTQFIYYKNGFEFSAEDIPQLKQIIELITHDKNYPIEKLNIQFKHLKENLLREKLLSGPDAEKTSCSSWNYQNFKTVMDVEHYQIRNQSRIKITMYLIKK